MGKRKNLSFSVSFYKHAPESFNAYLVSIDHPSETRAGGKHSYYKIPLTSYQKSELGNLAITKGSKAACDEAKRIYRTMLRQQSNSKNLTYIYHLQGEPNQLAFVWGCSISASAPMAERLKIKREITETMQSVDWKLPSRWETGALQVAGDRLAMVKKEEPPSKIDPSSQFCISIKPKDIWRELGMRQEKTKQPSLHETLTRNTTKSREMFGGMAQSTKQRERECEVR